MLASKTEDFIQGLKKAGLTRDEALLYYTLIQHGKKGTYIKDLTSHISIKRTTIYSIINRLHEKGYVVINPHYEGPKGAKMYAAISPELFINRIIILKRKELELLEKIKLEVIEKLETIYLESLEFSLKEIDNFLKPYLKPLYEEGWKVLEHIVEKSQITNGFEAYDISLLVSDAKIVKDAGFMVFRYNRDVEKDKNTLNYMFDMLSRKGKEEILNKGLGVVDVKLIITSFEIKGRKFKGHLPEFKFENSNKYVQLTETIMIPIKNKIFFLWAENHEFILKMIDAIFKVEKEEK
ncbi:MAG: helix-turn-helix domain-containing protein [Candidatus Odinarchaeota archaeon]